MEGMGWKTFRIVDDADSSWSKGLVDCRQSGLASFQEQCS